MKLSDMIEQFINEELKNEGQAELRRTEIAKQFSCVPSQINYVLSSRFTPELGYLVESRRGGGGYIRITRVGGEGSGYVMHIVGSVGDTIDAGTALSILQSMHDRGMMDTQMARIMASAVSRQALGQGEEADRIRASVFKNMLVTLAS